MRTVQEDDWIAGRVHVPDPDGYDLLLWTRTWPVSADIAARELGPWKRAHVPIVGYHLDRWSGLSRARQMWIDPYWDWLDWWFSADPAEWVWAERGVRAVWTPPAVSTRWLDDAEPDPARWPYQIIFVGNATTGYHVEHTHRPAMLAELRKRYGRRFAMLPEGDRHTPPGQRIHPRELSVLYATVPVVVGDSCLAGVDAYWSDRVPETIGRSGVLVHPDTDWRHAYTPGVHLATFGAWDFEVMTKTIDRLLDNEGERAMIRKLGRAHVIEQHTYTERIRVVLETVLR